MNIRYTLWWIFGILLIVLGMVQGILSGWEENTGTSALIVSGIVVVIFLFGKELRTGEGLRQDERTKKIGAWGLSYSWFVTFITLFILFWIRYLNLVSLDPQMVILLLVLEMAISVRLFQWYFFRRGDVE